MTLVGAEKSESDTSASTEQNGTLKPVNGSAETANDDARPTTPEIPGGLAVPTPSDANSTIASSVVGLPRLNYNLWDHKTKLFIVSGLLVLECSLLPIILFYSLWFSSSLRHGILFAIITSFFGVITGLEFVLRSYKLLFAGETYRPLGSTSRWHLDATHWTLITGYTIMTGILIGASIPYEPLVRPLAMVVPLFFIQLSLQLLLTGVLGHYNYKTPFMISSIPKGARIRPLVYTLVEDVVAVDGSAGQSYRTRLALRYDASARFRQLIAEMNWFWGIGGLLDGVGTMIVLFLPQVPETVAYGIGWGSPFVFVLVWTIVTLHWVRRDIRIEKEKWINEQC